MKTFMTAAAIAAVTATSATTALASGPIAPPPPYVAPPPVPMMYDWTGGYVGLRVGIPNGENFWTQEGPPPTSSIPGNWEGTVFGLTAGYDVQRGAMVFGAALDYTHGDIEAISTTNAAVPGFACLTGCVTTVENQFAIRGRVGRAFDRTLVYATAGFASGEATASEAGLGVLGNDRLNGWVAGLGIEHAVNNSLSVSLEYLHTNLGTLEIPTSCNINCTTDVSFGTFRLGANFRF